ncbi:Protein Nav2 [Operophtera brumata]|uniref:Protein Nav2 n=1 Tax=Operophtera brumata TaxID=104452 RepID=A0A0L7L6K7_OPEBR|nr:Protein Nav2 [Operophtera brumata]
MAESLFDIFGDHHTLQVVKNVTRQPLPNIENMGKMVSAGPIKPNEPTKKAGDSKNKKSFLSNAGKVLQSTPVRKAFTPRAANVASLIYSDESDKDFKMEEIEFTKPTYKYADGQLVNSDDKRSWIHETASSAKIR